RADEADRRRREEDPRARQASSDLRARPPARRRLRRRPALEVQRDRFSATAARTSASRAGSSIGSPSRMSIARLACPPRPELKSPDGSSSDAPLANVSLTTLL